MALILNLETTTTVCSVSLARDGKLIALKELNGGYSHAENLTNFIQSVCDQANLKIKDIDAIAVSKGPGSYTGLRIGVSTAKGLCFSLDKPLISINTLQHMSLSISKKIIDSPEEFPVIAKDSLFCPMLDARRMEVYCGIFNFSNDEVISTEAKIIDKISFSELLKSKQVVFFGDGSTKCKELLSNNRNAIFIDDVTPSANNMISLSDFYFHQKFFENVIYFEPYYLKDFMIGKPNLI